MSSALHRSHSDVFKKRTSPQPSSTFSLPRPTASSPNKAYIQLSEDQRDALHISIMKRLFVLFPTLSNQQNLPKSIDNSANGIITKRRYWWNFLKKPSIQQVQATTVMKIHLCISIKYASMPYKLATIGFERRIPILVFECCKFIKLNGLQTVGLFRVSGSDRRISNMLNEFNQSPGYGFQFNFDGYSVFDVSDCLKKYLRCLPEPLLTSILFPYFLQTLGHLVLFDCLIDLLGKVEKNSEINQMTVSNLARVFSPNILKPAELLNFPVTPNALVLLEYEKSTQLLEFIIINRDEFMLTGQEIFPFQCLDLDSIVAFTGLETNSVGSSDMLYTPPLNIRTSTKYSSSRKSFNSTNKSIELLQNISTSAINTIDNPSSNFVKKLSIQTDILQNDLSTTSQVSSAFSTMAVVNLQFHQQPPNKRGDSFAGLKLSPLVNADSLLNQFGHRNHELVIPVSADHNELRPKSSDGTIKRTRSGDSASANELRNSATVKRSASLKQSNRSLNDGVKRSTSLTRKSSLQRREGSGLARNGSKRSQASSANSVVGVEFVR